MCETPPSSGPNQPPSSGLLLPDSFPEADLPSEQAHSSLPSQPSQIDHYRVQRRLGLGGIAEVYLAVDEQGHPVAIKRLRLELAGEPVERTWRSTLWPWGSPMTWPRASGPDKLRPWPCAMYG